MYGITTAVIAALLEQNVFILKPLLSVPQNIGEKSSDLYDVDRRLLH